MIHFKGKSSKDFLLERAFAENDDGKRSDEETKASDDGEADQKSSLAHSSPVPGHQIIDLAHFLVLMSSSVLVKVPAAISDCGKNSQIKNFRIIK